MKQYQAFLHSEGDAWFQRCKDKIAADDPVIKAITDVDITPTKTLEVGCSNGLRLQRLKQIYPDMFYFGIDPSSEATAEDPFCSVGTARDLSDFGNGVFDLLIYGFCLYLVDSDDYFRVAAEGNRVLANGGYLVIHDFSPPTDPYRTAYKHLPGVFSHHTDFSKLWLCHPSYRLLSRFWSNACDGTNIWVIRKDTGWVEK